MAVSKVILNGQTLIDVTEDTVASNNLLQGNQATGADGQKVSGAYVAPTFSAQTKIVTPSESQQTILPDAGYDGLSQVQVGAIPSNYVGTGITQKAAQTYTPGTTNQTIAAGQYLSGAQTILGDANLVASNIASGVSIFGVHGTHEGGGGSTDDAAISIIERTVSGTYANSELTVIGSYAFAYCSSLTTASFPAATVISGSAFTGCGSLTEIYAPHVSLKSTCLDVFTACANLESVHIDLSATSAIPRQAFAACHALKEVSFPNVSIIYSGAFRGCENLSRVIFPNATVISAEAFQYCSGLTSIDFPLAKTISVGAFSGCSSLQDLSLPEVTTIGSMAFYSLSSLSFLSLPKVKTIYNNAFKSCKSLAYASLPMLSTVSSEAFSSCTNLSYVYAPSLSSIGDYAFAGCGFSSEDGFELVAPNISRIGSSAFLGTAIKTFENSSTLKSINGAAAFSKCSILSIVSIQSVTSIGEGCFYSCSNLETVYAPCLQDISSNAFYGCGKLSQVTFASSITFIGSSAFNGCILLSDATFLSTYSSGKMDDYAFTSCGFSSVVLPMSGTIGTGAFYYCQSLRYFKAMNVTTIGRSAFARCSNLTVYLSNVQMISGAAFASVTGGSLYLLGSLVCLLEPFSLTNGNPFYSAAITVYVKESLFSNYKTTVYWGTNIDNKNRLRSITDAEIAELDI